MKTWVIIVLVLIFVFVVVPLIYFAITASVAKKAIEERTTMESEGFNVNR